jgi:anaerobic selenocysteine-containing dehydrogenase
VLLTIDDDDRIVAIRGDKDSVHSDGYVCFKGLQAEESHHGPARLLHALKREESGEYSRIPMQQALDEIAERMGAIIDQHGSRSIGLFAGAQAAGLSSVTQPIIRNFLAAIGSDQYYSTVTIDQSAKIVSFERLGGWAAGMHDLESSEVAMLFGTNPLVSHMTIGLLAPDPVKRLKRAKANGFKLICIDTRLSETARHADIFLQPIPGHDAEIAAALIRIILDEGWHDPLFCAQHVGADRLADLRTAVDPFTQERVEVRAGLNKGELFAVAASFARDHKRGAAFTGTGPSMAPFSNLMQHLVDCLNVICGRFRRAGERTPVSPLEPPTPLYAEVTPPPRSWQSVPPSRIRGVGLLYGEKLSATLADEILQPGEGQIRCLIVHSSNAANCIPQQERVVEALQSLDLMVVIDPYMTVTAQLAHYVLPTTLFFERPDITLSLPGYPFFPESWAQYTPALLKPPPDSDVIDDWRFYWEICVRLGRPICYDGKVELDMRTPPTMEQLLDIRMSDAAISADEIRRHSRGKIYDLPHGIVQPARSDATSRFDVMPADVAAECERLAASMNIPAGVAKDGRPFTHLLASRRLPEVFNTTGTLFSATLKRRPYNPAFLHPEDMIVLQLLDGDTVKISSAHGQVTACVQPDAKLRRGVVQLPHGWGGHPGASEGTGTSVNLLTSNHIDYEPINAMPVMSALPVNIVRHM